MEIVYCRGSALKMKRRLPPAHTTGLCFEHPPPRLATAEPPLLGISGGGLHASSCRGRRLRLTSGASPSPGPLLLMLAWMRLSVPTAWLCLPTVGTDESVHSPPTAVATLLQSMQLGTGWPEGSSSGMVSQGLFSLLHPRPSLHPPPSRPPHALCPVSTHCYPAVTRGSSPHPHQVQSRYQESMPVQP